jgi:hypothetical protein
MPRLDRGIHAHARDRAPGPGMGPKLLGYHFIFWAVAEAVERACRSTRLRTPALNRALAAEPQAEIN